MHRLEGEEVRDVLVVSTITIAHPILVSFSQATFHETIYDDSISCVYTSKALPESGEESPQARGI